MKNTSKTSPKPVLEYTQSTRREFIAKAALGLGALLLAPRFSKAQPLAEEPTDAKTKAILFDQLGLVKGKTRLKEALKQLEEKGVTNVVKTDMEFGHQGYYYVAAVAGDGLLDVLHFQSYGDRTGAALSNRAVFSDHYPLAPRLKPGTVPERYAIQLAFYGSVLFITAENLYVLQKDGSFKRSVLVYKDPTATPIMATTAVDLGMPQRLVKSRIIPLEKMIGLNGGEYSEPKFKEFSEKNWVVLAAKNNAGELWQKVMGFRRNTGEYLGYSSPKNLNFRECGGMELLNEYVDCE